MNRIISVIILIFCLFCFSCETLIQPDDRERKINDIETPFDFSTAREVDVTIKAENEAGEAVSRVYFELLKDEHLLSTGQTNNTGEFNSTIVIPTYLQSLTIRSRAGQKEVSVTNGDIDYTYKIDNKTNNSTNSLKKNTAATCYSYNVHYTQEIRNSCIKFEDAGYWPGEWEEDPLGEDGLVETDIFIIKVQDSVETINLTLKAGPSTEEVTLNGVGDSKSALGFECTFVSRSYAWWETYQYKIGITSDDVKGRGRWGTKALSNVEFCFGNGSTVDQADYWTKRYSGCTQEAPDGIDNDYDGFIDEGFEDLDADNDGVVDANDAYPDDPEKAFNNYYPDKDQFGTLAYEDKWPIQGDYDFNDLIIGYNFNHVVKNIEGGTNQVVQIDASLVVRATGARYENGFGLEFENLSPDDIENVTNCVITENYIVLNADGVETGQQNAVVIPFDNTYSLFDGSAKYINTGEYGPTDVEPDTLSFTIELENVNVGVLDAPPYDPFLIIDKDRGYEVHLTDYDPTIKAASDLFGTGDDTSNDDGGQYYIDANNMPWALHIPEEFDYPLERKRIDNAYHHFADWAASDGNDYTDWYKIENEDYRNSDLIYSQ